MMKVNLVFFGTSTFASPALKRLSANKDFEIQLVVTRPDRPAGRGMKMESPPVKKLALELGLKIIQPEKVNDASREIQKLKPDFIVVCAYGKIIPKEILDIPKIAPLNIHPSLLPQLRGPSPIESAILEGLDTTGVTIIKMSEQMDAGPIAAQEKVNLSGKETGTELSKNLADIAARLIEKTIIDCATGEISFVQQNENEAPFTKLFKNEDYELNFSAPKDEILRKVRAFADSPGAYIIKDGKRLKIFRAKIDGEKLIATEIQWEGKKRIPAEIILND